MTKKSKQKQSRVPAHLRKAKVRSHAGAAKELDWSNVATVLLVEYRNCRCGAVHACPSPSLMMKQKSLVHLKAERLTVLKASTVHPDPLLPQYIQTIDVPIPRCPECFQERNGQGELFPQQRFLGVTGMRPPKTAEEIEAEEAARLAASATKPKAKPLPITFF